jgi:TIR domain
MDNRTWAEWIAWTLEAAGYRVLIQAWDMAPGTNWILTVDEGMRRAERTIAVGVAAAERGRRQLTASSRPWQAAVLRLALTVAVAVLALAGSQAKSVSFGSALAVLAALALACTAPKMPRLA